MDPSAEQTGHEQKKVDIHRPMFKAAVTGNWSDIKKEFQTDKGARKAKITSSEETVVHFAVVKGQRAVVEELIDLLPSNFEKEEILLTRNKRGNTPLHIAAAQGDWDMCDFLASVSAGSLIRARNNNGETPLFLAALRGKKEAFFVLHHKLKDAGLLNQISEYIRRNDGNTILHVAISGEYFDLAFQIIKMYQDVEKQGENVLVNKHNVEGQSALHFLANIPHAFRSGYHLGPVQQIIYSLIWVDGLEKKINGRSFQQRGLSGEDDKNVFPENYNTCWNFFKPVRSQFEAKGGERKERNKSDTENPQLPQPNGGNDDGKHVGTKNTVTYAVSQLIPPNYVPLFRFLCLVMELTLGLLGFGFWNIKKIRASKERHTWAVQVMDELVQVASAWEYSADGKAPEPSRAASWLPTDSPDSEGPEGSLSTTEINDESQGMGMKSQGAEDTRQNGRQAHLKHESPSETSTDQKTEDGDISETSILVASKNGVVEMVEKILRVFPVAIQDENKEGKNIVLLAVEHRQLHVYKLLLKMNLKDSALQKVDKDGNSALHLAVKVGNNRPCIMPGPAQQLQWEIKWSKFIKESTGANFVTSLNDSGITPKQIFDETHQAMVSDGSKWLVSTSQAASVIGVLVATLAYTAIITVPGSFDEKKKMPILGGKRAFPVFVVANLLALCFSMTSITMDVEIFSSYHQIDDFESTLPRQFANALTFLFLSILSIIVSFFAACSFVTHEQLKPVIFPVSYVAVFPLVIWMVLKLPFYYRLLKINYGRAPLNLKVIGKEKPILIAAKNGIVEVVEKILNQYPQAIYDLNEEGKNVVLIAVEKGHVRVYRRLSGRYKRDSALRQMDRKGNSALHLAAKSSENRPWNIPGAAMELQCEFRWFKYIEESMGENFFTCLKDCGKTPKQIFDETRQEMFSKGSNWLVSTSQAASVIAVLVATLEFTAIIIVPGSFDDENKTPLLGGKNAFHVFVVANFLALCFSMTSITMNVDIFSSYHQIDDFESTLPRKFANALTFLFLSILSILVSFFAACSFLMHKQLKSFLFPVSYVAVFPLVIWMVSKLPFYYRLLTINYGGAPLTVY